MPKLQATRGAQYLLVEEFVLTHQNWVVDSADGANIRLTLAYTVANATAGKARVRVSYTLDGRIHEAVTS